MHPVIMRQLAADRIGEMHAKAEDERLARQARPAPASRAVHATKASTPSRPRKRPPAMMLWPARPGTATRATPGAGSDPRGPSMNGEITGLIRRRGTGSAEGATASNAGSTSRPARPANTNRDGVR